MNKNDILNKLNELNLDKNKYKDKNTIKKLKKYIK